MNKTILITGGTGKVGSQLVKHFYSKNFNIIFTSKYKKEIDVFLYQNEKSKKQNFLKGFAINLINENATSKILNFFDSSKIWPHYIINCARNLNYLKIGPNGITSKNNFLGELTLDVIVPYELSMNAAINQNSNLESIINISSIYGIVPANPNLYINYEQESPIQYGVAKAAQIHLTKELAIRLAPKKIKVNTISYGGIEGRVDEEFKKRYAKLCPLSQMLKDEDVISAVDFLICNSSTPITGHNLVVDGGWSIW